MGEGREEDRDNKFIFDKCEWKYTIAVDRKNNRTFISEYEVHLFLGKILRNYK